MGDVRADGANDSLMYKRGERDGLAGLGPSSTSRDYMRGYGDGRRARWELRERGLLGDDGSPPNTGALT